MERMFLLCAFLVVLPLAAAETGKGLLIVTTDSIKNGSAVLGTFVTEKEKRGWTVRVVTESDYGAADKKGLERAVAIREWLKMNTVKGDYLLLIGDAHAQYGDVPMFIVWPRHAYPSDQCGGYFPEDCRSFESDAPYADLSGNWDLNGNGRWGEHELDEGAGGFDLDHELVVGRMSVHFDDTTEIDRMLDHAIDYMNATASAIELRKKILLPAAFYYFKGQQMVASVVPADVDGADLAEWFVHHVVKVHEGFGATRLYEKEGTIISKYPAELALTQENLRTEWPRGYGMVFWFGHGLEQKVGRTVWFDGDADGMPQQEELQSPLFIHADDASLIGDRSPAFVVAVSCEVGSAPTPGNLTHSLLTEGAAIGMIASSDITPGDATDYSDMESSLDLENYGASNLGMRFFDELMRGGIAADIFSAARRDMGTNGGIETYAGKMMLNYFGDPTLSLYDHTVNEEPPDDDTTTDGDSAANDDVMPADDIPGGCALTIY